MKLFHCRATESHSKEPLNIVWVNFGDNFGAKLRIGYDSQLPTNAVCPRLHNAHAARLTSSLGKRDIEGAAIVPNTQRHLSAGS